MMVRAPIIGAVPHWKAGPLSSRRDAPMPSGIMSAQRKQAPATEAGPRNLEKGSSIFLKFIKGQPARVLPLLRLRWKGYRRFPLHAEYAGT